MPRKRNLTVSAGKSLAKTASFRASGAQFVAGNVKIDEEGVDIPDKVKSFSGIKYADLEVQKTIGRGASSVVSVATHKSTGVKYAMKCINMYDKSKRNQLLSELHTLYVSDCAALVQFYGATYHEGTVAVTLEFMDLGGLDNVLAKFGPVPEKPLAAMAFQVLWGLGYLRHEKRVHRDIKPQNILANSKGEVKLTDFGISKELEHSIMCQTFVGSFKYLSPERMQHKSYKYAADIWSFGIVLMEMATGAYPYPESSSALGYVHSVTEGDAPALPKDGDFTSEFRDFLSKLVTKDPKARTEAAGLLSEDWLRRNGAVDIESSVVIVRKWFEARSKEMDEAKAAISGSDAAAAAAAAAAADTASTSGGAGGGAGATKK